MSQEHSNNDMAGTRTRGGILGKIKQLSFYPGGKKSELSIKSLLSKEQLGSFVFDPIACPVSYTHLTLPTKA